LDLDEAFDGVVLAVSNAWLARDVALTFGFAFAFLRTAVEGSFMTRASPRTISSSEVSLASPNSKLTRSQAPVFVVIFASPWLVSDIFLIIPNQ
jgi:hypothetical protein